VNIAIPKPGTEYIVYVDPRKCMGCRSCEIACAVEHSVTKSIYTAHLEKPTPIPRIRVILGDDLYVPMRCQHCRDPPCMAVCPTKAISKTDEGFVVVDPLKCIGCTMCALACPFGHPRFASEKYMVKCDFCVDRVRRGQLPACVEACPTGALIFGKIEDVMRYVAEERARAFVSAVTGLIEFRPLPELEKVLKVTSPVQDILNSYSKVSWYRG